MKQYKNMVNAKSLAALGINPIAFEGIDTYQIRECIEEFNGIVEKIISDFPDAEFLAFIYLHKCYEPEDVKKILMKRFAKNVKVGTIVKNGNRAKNRLLDVLPQDKNMTEWRKRCNQITTKH